MNTETQSILALSMLTSVGPARLQWILSLDEDPARCIEILCKLDRGKLDAPPPRGVSKDLIQQWKQELRLFDIDRVRADLKSEGVGLLTPASDHWPFLNDLEPPGILFTKGNSELLAQPSVAIVGTRRCSSVGRKVAHTFGNELAEMGVAVVSGLALGIDRAAHQGVTERNGSPIAVVGSGLDKIYPRSNSTLWEQVGKSGLLLSEYPLGVEPKRWHFPARNRIIAGLSQGVVVIESHAKGGSLSTAVEAVERDKPVMVVPGSVLSAACVGSNALLVDGAVPVTTAADVAAAALGFVDMRDSSGAQIGVTESPLTALIMAEANSGSGTIDNVFLQSDCTVETVFLELSELANANKVRLVGSRLEVI